MNNYKEAHKQKHVELHKALVELSQDFIHFTGKELTNTTLKEFLDWSLEESGGTEPVKERIKIVPNTFITMDNSKEVSLAPLEKKYFCDNKTRELGREERHE